MLRHQQLAWTAVLVPGVTSQPASVPLLPGVGNTPNPQGSPGTLPAPALPAPGSPALCVGRPSCLLLGWVLLVGDAIHLRFSDVHTVPRCADSLPTSSCVCHTVTELLPRGGQPLVLQPQAGTGGPVPIPERKALKEGTSGPEPRAQVPAGWGSSCGFCGGHPGPCGPSGRAVSVALH